MEGATSDNVDSVHFKDQVNCAGDTQSISCPEISNIKDTDAAPSFIGDHERLDPIEPCRDACIDSYTTSYQVEPPSSYPITNQSPSRLLRNDTMIMGPMESINTDTVEAVPINEAILVQAKLVDRRNSRTSVFFKHLGAGITITILIILVIIVTVLATFCADGSCFSTSSESKPSFSSALSRTVSPSSPPLKSNVSPVSNKPFTNPPTDGLPSASTTLGSSGRQAFRSSNELQKAVYRFLFNISLDTLYEKYGNIERWDVSRIGDFSGLFSSERATRSLYFNEDLSNWDVSSAFDMSRMFQDAEAFNQNLCKWNVSGVKSVIAMFMNAKNFQGDVSCWDVSQVEDATDMFAGASKFNSDLSRWNVSSLVNANSMFSAASSFRSDLSSWDTSKIRSVARMFSNAHNFNSDLSKWNISLINSLDGFAYMASNFDFDVSGWDTSNVDSMSSTFAHAVAFKGTGIDKWDVRKVGEMPSLFYGAKSFDADLSLWDVSSTMEMGSMFAQATSFQGKGLEHWNVSNVVSMNSMFHLATEFDCDLSQWNVSQVDRAESLFSRAQSFRGIGLDKWNLKKKTVIAGMFYDAVSFNRAFVENWTVNDIDAAFLPVIRY
jgi:surface protein